MNNENGITPSQSRTDRYTTIGSHKFPRESSRIEVVPNDRAGKEFLIIKKK